MMILGKRKVFVIWALILAVAVAGIIVGRWSIGLVNAEVEGYENIKVFTEALSIIKRNYVEDMKTKDLVYGAIRGMLNSLDPHSAFMTPEAYKEMQVDTKGEFGGLGIQIGIKDSFLTVIAPIEDTPAYKAGIMAGDRIIKINDEGTKDMSLLDAVNKMRGTKGTSVKITVVREGWKEPKDFSIMRDIIKVKSVKYKILEDGIGYVKITQFQEQTANDLSNALAKLNDDNKVGSLILDLRNNPGGLLNSAVDVSSQFLPAGKLVVYIKDRTGEKTEYKSGGNKPFYDKATMVVLVNQGSASASEIVAGALKDWHRAVILGVQTFGKGSVQSVVPLSDGSGLRLTTARYYTPNGISIQSTGIAPDIVAKIEAKNGTKEHAVVREKDLERHLRNDREEESTQIEQETAPLEVSEKDDVQLQRAIDLLKTWKVFKELPKAS
ncbi:MAG TPA: S41 family peptidase [Thermodesulfovibrionales bacterium]|nr:S41 family peptidase [Thermodesulfovibrionales bacterium]